MLNSAIKIGCDPEVFAKDETGNFVSAHGLIPGTKEKPFPVELGAVQVDGMAFEFNTDPALTRESFVQNVTGVFGALEQMLPSNLSLAPGIPVAHFTPDVFDSQPEAALELGCEPDYNAYTGKVNPRPDGSKGRMRTAAGHIHIGWTEGVEDPTTGVHFNDCCNLIMLLDGLVGLDSLSYDDDVERRELYGMAGAFRAKSYGVEYRVLSNAWLRSPDLMGRVYDSVVLATSIFQQGAILDWDLAQEVQSIINRSDTAAAERVLAQIKEDFGL